MKKGEFKYILGMDCETSGIGNAGTVLQPYYSKNGYYQTVSWGLAVIDSTSFKIVDKLYVEIKWNGESLWDAKAEAVHGLSKEYLEDNGVTEEEAVVIIGNFIIKWFGPAYISCLGHNVATFDIPFLIDLFHRFDMQLKLSHRHYDTNTLALVCTDNYNSDDFFEAMDLPARGKHNALEDLKYEITAARRLKAVFKQLFTVEV
jgi:hypothetical protein